MFTTLLESTPQRRSNRTGAIISALFHSALIVAAVYATASGAASRIVATAATQATTIHWAKPSAQPAAAPAKPAKPKTEAKKVVAPTKIATETPPIDPNAQPTTEPETGPTSPVVGGGGVPGAYNAFEVEVEVVAIASSIRPQYPEALRSSGTEGTVVAEFIVNEKGRADKESFRIISTTHKLFADAVLRALPQMRFKPAKIGGKPVSQLVQQQFVFRMDR